MADVETFLPTGLLGGLGSSTNNYAKETNGGDSLDSATSVFVPNGLLTSLGCKDFTEALEAEEETQENTLVETDSIIFQSNGLLENRTEDVEMSFNANDLPGRSSIQQLESSFVISEEGKTQVERTGESDQQEFTLEDACGGDLHVASQQGAREDTQEELPSLSDLLRPFTPRVESSISRAVHPFPSSIITATTFDGKPLNLRRRRKPIIKQTVAGSHQTACLLETPIHKLMEKISEKYAMRLAHQDVSDPSSSSSALSCIDSELWVDRYRPSRFTDLLGDERVHRETMGWLKEWDRCVFGKRRISNRQKKASNEGEAQNHYEDAHHRPREKILLLSGPAGYGKTTLAHVAASQAGYEVMEINASDSRSGQVIDDRVRPALETGSKIGSRKPVCVVIDEIDGATGAGENTSTFIHKLIGLTFEKSKKKGRGDKGKDAGRPLLRPIICICNDLYASALTKLRQHARIIRFTRPAEIYLTRRLREICSLEGLKAESRALTTLVGISKGDMRGCLNTLQFIKARNQEVTETIIRTATTGMKEADSSLASVLSNLFAPLPKKRVKELGLTENEESRYVGRLSADLDACGFVDRVALGCFEHYANLRHFEASLDRHGKAAEWLVSFDCFSGTMRSEREYGLLSYLSYALVPFYPLFNERGGSKVERPKADWENLMKTRTSEEIYKSLSKCVQTSASQKSAGLRHLLANEILQLEFGPYINRIISPPLRPINSQVTKPQERALLSRLVDIMISLELHYVQEKAEDGQLVYRLEPPIDIFVTYDGKRASDIAVQRYAARHLIAGEIDAKLIVRHAEAIDRGRPKFDLFKSARKLVDDRPDDDEKGTKGGDGIEGSSPVRPARPPLGKRKAEELDIADKPPVDFFGRPISTTLTTTKKSKGSVEVVEKKYRVSYRYNEGSSAAVRMPVKVSAFL